MELEMITQHSTRSTYQPKCIKMKYKMNLYLSERNAYNGEIFVRESCLVKL